MNREIIAILISIFACLIYPQQFYAKVPQKANFEALSDSSDYKEITSLEEEILFLINRHRNELPREAQEEDIDFSKAEKIYRVNDLTVFKEKPASLILDSIEKNEYIWRLPVNVGNLTIEVYFSRPQTGTWTVSSINLHPECPFYKDIAQSILTSHESSPKCYAVTLVKNKDFGIAAICFWGESADYLIPLNDSPGRKFFNADIISYSDAVSLMSTSHYKGFFKRVELQTKSDSEKLEISSEAFKIMAGGLSLLIIVFSAAKKKITTIEK